MIAESKTYLSHFGGITVTGERGDFKLTRPQNRIMMSEKLFPGTPLANIPVTARFTGEIDFKILEEAINIVIYKNDCLRLRLKKAGDETRQYVQSYVERKLDFFDFSGEYGQQKFHEWLDDRKQKPFVLYDSDLFYAALIKFNNNEQGFYFNIHHVAGDGYTVGLIVSSVIEYYNKLKNGEQIDNSTNPSYFDFLKNEDDYFNSPDFEIDKKFWNDKFTELPEEINLSLSRGKAGDIRAKSIFFPVPSDIGQEIFRFCENEKISFYRLLMAAYYTYISRVTRREDVVAGMPSHGRSTPGERKTAGMFVCTFPLRLNVNPDLTFRELLEYSNRELLDILKNHTRYPYEMLYENLAEKHGKVPNLVNLVIAGQESFSVDNVTAEYHYAGFQQMPNSLLINVFYSRKTWEDYKLEFVYSINEFTEAEVERINEHLMNIVTDAIRNPDKKVSQLNLLSLDEEKKLLYDFNDTHAEFPTGVTVPDLIKEQAKKYPDKDVVVYKNIRLTYSEFNRRTNQLARLLINKGVKPDEVVGVMVDPSVEMMTGPVGILKSGAAYLPIDHKYAVERIKYTLQDSNAKILLTLKHLENHVPDFGGEVIFIDDENLYSGDGGDFETIPKPENLAYIIYTSGSTGKPKGVMIEHHSLLNLACYWNKERNITSSDNLIKYAGFGFDASVMEMYPPITTGASLHIIPDEIKLSPKELNEYFEKNNITGGFLPTQFLEQFMELTDNKSLRYIDTGGDKLKRFNPQNYTVYNNYGPTEFTVCTTSFIVDKYYDNIPIGKPVPNSGIYIVDRFNNLMPVGIPGELCVSGAGIARGYMGRPDLTAERFVENPFNPGTKMYHTGDLARWLPDGNIEFLGRIDFQVKIRGFRIELGEIENQMLRHQGVKESVVLARDDQAGNKYLCGYFVADEKIDIAEFQGFLTKELPDYMVPPFMIQMDEMPVNTSGKIDRKALPEPGIKIQFDPPTNIIEEKLAEMWKEVLNIEEVGINNNFFNLGGHSLKAVLLQSKIEKEFKIDVSLNDIFNKPTIREIGEIIRNSDRESSPEIQPAPEQEYYNLASAQKRLYVVEQMQGVGTTYNVPLILEFKGKLDKEKLGRAIDKLVQRHEALRTSFDIVDGKPVQKIHPSVKIRRNYREVDEKDIEQVVRDFITPFDLQKPPLFRILLLKIDSDRHLLVFDVHHTIFDGSSMVILVKELAALYADRNLPPLPLQFKDFAEWQNRFMYSDSMVKQENFWQKTFADEVPVLDFPTDFQRPSVQDYNGEKTGFVMDSGLTQKLKKFTEDKGITMNVLMMSAFYVLLARYSSADDVVIGASTSGRNHLDIQNIIGMFVNTIPVRSKPGGEKKFSDFLTEVKQNFLQAYDNQDYPLDYMVDKLRIKRDASRNPMFDVGFVTQNMGFPKIQIDDLFIKPRAFSNKVSRFDFTLEVIEDEDTILTSWEYRTSLFKRQTIERMSGHLRNILESVINKPDLKIRDINLLSKEEECQLLYDFNKSDAEWPNDKTVHQIFEKMVEQYPDNIAVVFENQQLTYRQLNERANQLARMLRNKGVKPDTIVGIMIEKCLDMIVGLVGIIKAGGCYLPIKPDFPTDRINFMLENSEAPILLTVPEFYHLAGDYKGEVIDFTDEKIYCGDSSNLENINSPSDMIYIIYTSGSTGKPKGVMLEHRNIVRLFHNSKFNSGNDYYNFNDRDVWSLFHSFCFDFSVWEMYGALLYGGKIVLVPRKTAMEPAEFLKLLKREKVTVLSQTPGAFYNLIEEDLRTDDHDLCIRYVTFGGEELKPAMLKKWHDKYPDAKLINMYGITETTVHVTYREITDREIDAKISNIGIPIPTLRTYIMDKNLKLVPVGVPGEICVAGDGVARGYLKRPEKTAEVFVENPYIPGERIYRSGDLARMLPNGEMEYLGRIDFQVKIRGFRVELGEIENLLLKHENISKAVVIAKQDRDGNRYLAAYYEADRNLTIPELKEYLLKQLPDYMVPSYFVKLDKMPLTPNGKVSRKELPDPTESVQTGAEFIKPRNDAEEKILKAWRKILELDRISVIDNFFDLGGHSLKAVALVAELQKEFDVTVNEIFEFQTVAKLAENIRMRKDNLKNRIVELKQMESASVQPSDPGIIAEIEKYHNKNRKYDNLDYSKIKQYRNVLVTGTTGYLGIHLLKDLLLEKNCTVYTIIRAADDETAEKRLREKCGYYFGDEFFENYKDRIIILKGDLGSEKLGMSDDVYRKSASTVDCIIHPAAIVKHYGHYDEFYTANVKAVLNLLAFAKTGINKDFNHVSTVAVVDGTVEGKEHIVFTEYDIDVGQDSDNYYAKTKLLAEKAVEKARSEGLNANIYRIGNITINSKTGHIQQNIEENAFYLQVKSFLNLGVIPDTHDEVEFSFVDYVSRSIILSFDRENLMNETYHIQNSQVVKLSDVLTSPELQLNMARLPFDRFIDFLYDNYDRESFKPYIESIMLHRRWLSRITGDNSHRTDAVFLSDKTNLILDKLGFQWPELEKSTMMNMLIEALKDRIEFLKDVSIFSRVSDDEMKLIARIARPEVYGDETDILWEGDINDSFFLIVDGNIELTKHSRSGWLGTLGIAGPGSFIGEENIMGRKPSSVSAQALMGDVTVLKFRSDDIRSLTLKNPEIGAGFMEALTRRLDQLQRIIVNMG
jgi:amino acid adenylation domain-containing protein/thioester reductase-like protein